MRLETLALSTLRSWVPAELVGFDFSSVHHGKANRVVHKLLLAFGGIRSNAEHFQFTFSENVCAVRQLAF